MKHFVSHTAPPGLLTISKWIAKAPYGFLLQLGNFLGWITYRVAPFRKTIALANIALCFPERSNFENRQIACGMYQFLFRHLLIWNKFSSMNDSELAKIIDITFPDDLEEDLKQGKGVILVSGHIGYWELLPFALRRLDTSALIVYKKLTNDRVDKRVLQLRNSATDRVRYIEQNNSMTSLEAFLREGKVVGLLGDQKPTKSSLQVDFMQVRTSSHTGMAILHQKTGAPVWFVCITESDRPRPQSKPLRVIFQKFNAAGEFGVVHQFYQVLSDEISRDPRLYLWLHNRFKPAS
eukprot:TRINITY_DN6954_c0_g1_i1.p1 TRINITY_DN6954_c0_g1~~TRINITY_DN6954_c0_g1_i1.p1  ORF type:complete len:293 (+),score=35.86 TRINITY_DN6954_c0_g1_i1:104-982(+)